MTKDDVKLIEEALDIILPERYITEVLKSPLNNTYMTDCFFDDPRKIIRTNKRLREKGVCGSVSLQPHHLVIGRTDVSDYSFIDTSSTEDMVYYANRTKGWKYSPDNLRHNNSFLSLQKYIDHYLWWHKQLVDRETNPPHKETEEEAQKALDDFIALQLQDIEQRRSKKI